MARSGPEVADVFRHYGDAFREQHGGSLSTAQRRAMTAIEICRTAALGGHVEQCDSCGHQRISYNSCRNGSCPKCQSMRRAQWLDDRRAEILDTQYFHVVFTLPERTAAIALQNKAVVYDLLFRTAAETLRTIAADPKHLGAEIGFFGILHTWGSNLLHHPHIHFLVPGGGLSPDGTRWISCRRGYFLPVEVLSCLFRRLFIEALQKANAAGQLQFFSALAQLKEKSAFQRYLAPLRQTDWVVYAKPPFAGPEQVLDYVGRYTHRVAISNNRILDIDGGKVRFRWKDYRRRGQQKTMTVSAEEFIRRFLIHVPTQQFSADPLLRFPRQSLPCGEAGAVSSAPCHGGTPARRRQRGEGLSGPIRRADRRFALPMPSLQSRTHDAVSHASADHQCTTLCRYVMNAAHADPRRTDLSRLPRARIGTAIALGLAGTAGPAKEPRCFKAIRPLSPSKIIPGPTLAGGSPESSPP